MSFCRHEIQKERANSDMTTGFLDPGMVNERNVSDERTRKEVEEYVLKALLKEQDKHYVLLPYNFKYVFACVLLFVVSCTSLTRGGLTYFRDLFTQVPLDPPSNHARPEQDLRDGLYEEKEVRVRRSTAVARPVYPIKLVTSFIAHIFFQSVASDLI